MVGFFGTVTGVLDPDALRKAVADSIPPTMQKLNLEAFDKGFFSGRDLVTKLAESREADLAISWESA